MYIHKFKRDGEKYLKHFKEIKIYLKIVFVFHVTVTAKEFSSIVFKYGKFPQSMKASRKID